jgi:hypothetical protein
MNSKSLLLAAVMAVHLSANARIIHPWSEAELQNGSDIIVIGHPIAVMDLEETSSLGWSQTATFHPKFRGIETKFSVSRVLKGSLEDDRLVLHHYREETEWGSPPNGPIFIAFSPGSTNEYLLYLVRDGNGRYAPVAGQVDPYLSIESVCTNLAGESLSPSLDFADTKIKLRFVKADSEETGGEDGHGKNAVDGNRGTYWHTQWQNASPALPHEIVLELVPPSVIQGFTYVPRQDESDHGVIKGYEFYVSNDGTNFGQPVIQGEFGPGRDKKFETFEPVNCRFIKLRAISEINGLPWTSAAEIGVIGCQELRSRNTAE